MLSQYHCITLSLPCHMLSPLCHALLPICHLQHQSFTRHSVAWKDSLRHQKPCFDGMPGLRRVTLNLNPSIGDRGVKELVDSLRDDQWIRGSYSTPHCANWAPALVWSGARGGEGGRECVVARALPEAHVYLGPHLRLPLLRSLPFTPPVSFPLLSLSWQRSTCSHVVSPPVGPCACRSLCTLTTHLCCWISEPTS